MTDAPLPLPESSTAACRRCSAPLAADQRYCLSCGARVASPRVAYLDVLAGGGAAPVAAEPRARGRSFAHQLDRVGGPMGAAAVVLVALGVGFLIGQGSASTPSPQVVRPVVNVTNAGGATASGTGTASDAGASSGSGAKHAKGSGKGGDAGTKGVAPVTKDKTGGDINKLQQQPDQQATGGKPPAKDNKASGGGSATETIG